MQEILTKRKLKVVALLRQESESVVKLSKKERPMSRLPKEEEKNVKSFLHQQTLIFMQHPKNVVTTLGSDKGEHFSC